MYIDKITKEEEQCINDILSNGIDEINDIIEHTPTQTHIKPLIRTSSYMNDIPLQSQIQITDLNHKRDSIRDSAPKSSALRDLIDQLKKENNYILSSDDDEQRHQFQLAKKQQKTIKADIDQLEQSTSQFNAMKTQMDLIQKKMQKVSSRIDMKNKTNSITNRSYSYTLKQQNKEERTIKQMNTQTPRLSNIKKTGDNIRNSIGQQKGNNNNVSSKNIGGDIQRRKVRANHNEEEEENTNDSCSNDKCDYKPKDYNHHTYTINHPNKKKKLTLKENYTRDNQDINDDEDNYTFNQGSPINNQSKTYKSKIKHKAKTLTNHTANLTPNTTYHSESSTLLSKFSWKKKYDDLYSKHQHQLNEISSEEARINTLQNQIKVTNKKNANYNKLIDYNKQLITQDELLSNQIHESENIRKEQSKLIRSLQREIDMLRGDVDESNLNNIAEIYQSMKESLINSQSQSASINYMMNSQKQYL